MHNHLSQMLEIKILVKSDPLIEDELLKFQKIKDVIIPEDLKDYFRLLQYKGSEYNSVVYRFFPLREFKSINEELRCFDGTPDYSNIINTLKDYENCFVFGDY